MRKLIILIIGITAALIFSGCETQRLEENNTIDKTEEYDETVMDDKSSEEKQTEDELNRQEEDINSEIESSEKEDMDNNFLDTTLVDINENDWNLAELGEKAVIKVWASWCSICLSGMSEYNSFSEEYKDAKVLTVVSPGMFGEKDKDDFMKWYKGLEGVDNIIVILDEEGLLINNLGIRGFPTYIYLDSSGTVNSIAIGHQSTQDVITRLETIS